ncbi:hypothetical protein B0A52_06813 [Exophiala mesophila]|uniref:Uncharacterized protein n=1 Tax=Exophiala mesophila TaxID=212818 RepID=A0A438N064_EXOME|nr:hypothetical protein B0A52_06813 [Exophiala mesophila]
MLGARARAAEYNAFKAATARQATREAEELSLPPKATPISLSAFARNLQHNRNKGNKQFIPLIIEDTSDSDKDRPDDAQQHSNTASPANNRLENMAFNTQNHEIPAMNQSSSLVNVYPYTLNYPPSVPSVSDALNTVQDRSAALLNPTPLRVQSHSIISHPHSVASSEHSTPNHTIDSTHFPGGLVMQTFDVQRFPYLALPRTSLPTPHPNLSVFHYMTPDDISPAKQEDKLATLNRIYGQSSAADMQSQDVLADTPEMIDTLNWSRYSPSRLPVARAQFIFPSNIASSLHSPFQGTEVPQMYPEWIMTGGADAATAAANGSSSTVSAPKPHESRTESTVTPTGHEQESAESAAGIMGQALNQVHLDHHNDEPYDRSFQMQKFVAKQQALARTGKTVLHNPELHRQKNENRAAGGLATPFEESQDGDLDLDHFVNGTQPTVQPPPGLPWPGLNLGATVEMPMDTTTAATNVFQDFKVASDEWCCLNPLTELQRQKMAKALRLCATVDGIDAPRPLEAEDRLARLAEDIRDDDSSEWSQTSSRLAVDQIAAHHLNDRLLHLRAGETKEVAEMEAASIRTIGKILANLKVSDQMEGRNGAGKEYWCKYKAAPEYAIERSRLLLSGVGITSYFEEKAGGFYNTPVRIARDPRFRPANKDGVKIKSDDDWNLRHELFGRRRL